MKGSASRNGMPGADRRESLRCELISWAETERLCQRLAKTIRLSDYRPDLVIAIGRGGFVPARLLCDYLQIMDLTSIRIEHYLPGADRREEAIIRYPLKADIRGRRVLLVDDVNDSGDTLAVATQHLRAFQSAEIRTAVMHHKTVSDVKVDYCARKIIKWRWLIYPWALHEDISGFLRRATPVPGSLEEARRLLARRFAIEIPARRLRSVYNFIQR